MSDTDRRCHQIVADLTAELLALSADELLARPRHEVLNREVNGQTVWIGVDRHRMDDEYYVGIQLSRKWFWFIRKTYVNGVVFSEDSPPRKMTPLEADANH